MRHSQLIHRHTCPAVEAREADEHGHKHLRFGFDSRFNCGYCKDCNEWLFFDRNGAPFNITDDIPERHPPYPERVDYGQTPSSEAGEQGAS